MDETGRKTIDNSTELLIAMNTAEEKKPKKNKKKKKNLSSSKKKKRKQVHDDDDNNNNNNKEEQQQQQRQSQEVPQPAKKPRVVVASNDDDGRDEDDDDDDDEGPAAVSSSSSCGAAAAAAAEIVITRQQPLERPHHHHHPFATNPLDHCETPRRAYEQIAGVLRMLAANINDINNKNNNSNNKNNSNNNIDNNNDVMIWDPYYCDGAVVRHLHSLGFTNVWHENCDFYATIRSSLSDDNGSYSTSSSGGGILPDYDIFVTNPPYSDDHIDKLFGSLNGTTGAIGTTTTNTTTTTSTTATATATSSGTASAVTAAVAKIRATRKQKPFCLLLPNWVARKRNYRELLSSVSDQVVYLSPVIPYTYQMPAWNHHPSPLSPPPTPPPDAVTKMTTATSTTTTIPDHVTRANGATTPYLSSWYIYGLSETQFDELNALSNRHHRRHHGRPTDDCWVVAKTIKGLKWKIQQKQKQQQQQQQQQAQEPL
jgi:hypothetical protein